MGVSFGQILLKLVNVKNIPPIRKKGFSMTKQKTVYFGAGWFTETQNKAYKDAMSALNANPTIDLENSYVPLQNQYKDIRVDEHPEYLHDKEIRLMLNYMDTHFPESISLKELCDLIYLSETQVIRIFKKNTGKTPYEY